MAIKPAIKLRDSSIALILCAVLYSSMTLMASPERIHAFEQAAMERTLITRTYDGAYRVIDYPNGDVPDDIGVCTDVVIRSYRKIGIDLQALVHQDMRTNFEKYPDSWGHKKPDTNIDHRRVLNLHTFFSRHARKLLNSKEPDDFKAGDLVTWNLPGNLPHIGIVLSKKTINGERPLIVHNVGEGTVVQDFLFAYPITGHFRYGLDSNL